MNKLWIAIVLFTTSCTTATQPVALKSEAPRPENKQVERQGDPALRNGTATVREEHAKKADDPRTTNDESNDQPLGSYGTVTLHVRNISSGNSYPVDADVERNDEGFEVRRLYFLKGGWVDFMSCEVDEEYLGNCSDENGRDWEFEGEG